MNRQFLSGDPDSELYEVGEAVFSAEALDASFSLDDRDSADQNREHARRTESNDSWGGCGWLALNINAGGCPSMANCAQLAVTVRAACYRRHADHYEVSDVARVP